MTFKEISFIFIIVLCNNLDLILGRPQYVQNASGILKIDTFHNYFVDIQRQYQREKTNEFAVDDSLGEFTIRKPFGTEEHHGPLNFQSLFANFQDIRHLNVCIKICFYNYF